MMVEQCQQGTLNSAISSVPESDLSTLLRFHTPPESEGNFYERVM